MNIEQKAIAAVIKHCKAVINLEAIEGRIPTDDDIWTCEKILKIILNEFGKKVNV